MVTYESGKAPADAPVTWRKDSHSYFARDVLTFGGRICLVMDADNHRAEEVEETCRAFHLAALVDEVAGMLGGAPLTPPGTTDWLRRYRAAKGER